MSTNDVSAHATPAGVIRLGVAAFLVASVANAQQKPAMADQAFKNIRVLKGIPVDQFMATMGFFSASLGETCTDCHSAESGGSWEKYADDNPRKETARRMIGMMNAINKSYFGGRREITCYSCHRGVERPDVTPSLADLYGPPALKEPDELREPAAKAPSADQILDRYLQAIGGAEHLATITSFAAKGIYQGYQDEKYPIDVFAKAPNQLSTVVHTAARDSATTGDSITTYNGSEGWIAGPPTERPVSLLDLTDGELAGAKLDAALWFPAQIKTALTQWRGASSATIDGRDVQMIQGTGDGRYPVNLYFDSKSGLLARVVRYSESPVGLNPTQIDYADYREIAGVRMPYRVTVTWLDGKSTTQFSEIQPNVPIEAARFVKPRGAQ
jgi:photosynthetic reaction center cytochrome c subunit